MSDSDYLPLPRTEAAIAEYDRHYAAYHCEDHSQLSIAESVELLNELSRLDEVVGRTFGEETSERNNVETCAANIRAGAPVIPLGHTELSFVRRMVLGWREQQKGGSRS